MPSRETGGIHAAWCILPFFSMLNPLHMQRFLVIYSSSCPFYQRTALFYKRCFPFCGFSALQPDAPEKRLRGITPRRRMHGHPDSKDQLTGTK